MNQKINKISLFIILVLFIVTSFFSSCKKEKSEEIEKNMIYIKKADEKKRIDGIIDKYNG